MGVTLLRLMTPHLLFSYEGFKQTMYSSLSFQNLDSEGFPNEDLYILGFLFNNGLEKLVSKEKSNTKFEWNR